MRVGVLGIQGDVREHASLLTNLDAAVVGVKTQEDLDTIDALVLPGGESTTIGLLLDEHDMLEPIRVRIREGIPVLGTCAGAILLAQRVSGGDVPKLGLMDISIERNGYGRQVHSFEASVVLNDTEVDAIFIRAPVISQVGEDVEVLATHDDHPVVVRQKNMLAATFHPELSGDPVLHRMLVKAAV